MYLHRMLTLGVFAVVALTGTALFAQAPAVSTFTVERTVPLNNLLSTAQPNLTPDLLAGLQGNALEIRESLVWNPTQMTITQRMFLVAPGSPTPTPTGVTPPLMGTYIMRVDRVYTSTSPVASVMFTGTVESTNIAGPFGTVTGAPAAVAVRYTNATPPVISNIVALVAGTITSFSGGGAGNILVPSNPPVPGPGPGPGPGGGPTAVLAATDITTDQVEVELDASQSTGTGLTYSWRFLQKTGVITPPNGSRVRLQFGEGAGTYVIEVTVRDSAGRTSTAQMTVRNVRTLPF
jgi:hypothetical protein